jgi:hypothetical protein
MPRRKRLSPGQTYGGGGGGGIDLGALLVGSYSPEISAIGGDGIPQATTDIPSEPTTNQTNQAAGSSGFRPRYQVSKPTWAQRMTGAGRTYQQAAANVAEADLNDYLQRQQDQAKFGQQNALENTRYGHATEEAKNKFAYDNGYADFNTASQFRPRRAKAEDTVKAHKAELEEQTMSMNPEYRTAFEQSLLDDLAKQGVLNEASLAKAEDDRASANQRGFQRLGEGDILTPLANIPQGGTVENVGKEGIINDEGKPVKPRAVFRVGNKQVGIFDGPEPNQANSTPVTVRPPQQRPSIPTAQQYMEQPLPQPIPQGVNPPPDFKPLQYLDPVTKRRLFSPIDPSMLNLHY